MFFESSSTNDAPFKPPAEYMYFCGGCMIGAFAATNSPVATAGGIGSRVSSCIYSCTDTIPCRRASAGITVFEGLLIGSGIANGDVITGAEGRDVAGTGDVWLAAAGVDGGFHLGSANIKGIRVPFPLWAFGWPFTGCFRGWGCWRGPLGTPRPPPLPPLPTGGFCCCLVCPLCRFPCGTDMD